jgi:putative nucleotidyltransferase with HDIG domain
VAAVGIIGAALFAISWLRWSPVWSYQVAIVLVATALTETFAFTLPGFTISLAYPLARSAIILGGPATAGLAAALSSGVVPDIRSRRPVSIVAFNLSQQVLLACLGGWVYVGLGGPVLQQSQGLRAISASDFPGIFYAMAGAAVFVPLANLALTSLGVSLYQRQKYRVVFLSAAGVFLPTQVSLGFVGFLMAQVVSLQVVALPLFIFPLLVARQLYQRYLGLRHAYADTIRSLVGALEAKDPYTRGHSERVSQYAAALGEAMGLEPKSLERLEYAALLHDLGKLAVPGSVLTKPSRLDPSEMDRIREHPGRGAEMVRRIPPLRDLAEIVSQHHERVDGAGYPAGIAGNDMSLAARILAVADCYDAMTTTRAYRPALEREAALAELLAGADSQFDSAVVRQFVVADVATAVHPGGGLPGDAALIRLEQETL